MGTLSERIERSVKTAECRNDRKGTGAEHGREGKRLGREVKHPMKRLTRLAQFIKLVSMEGTIMGSQTEEVSAFEAKTRLSELLRETEKGFFRIFRRGKRSLADPPQKRTGNRTSNRS